MISDHVLWRGRGSHLIRAGVVTIMYVEMGSNER